MLHANQVVLSAPVQNQSGTGSSDSPAKVLTEAGQYNSVPVGAPAQGANATDRGSISYSLLRGW